MNEKKISSRGLLKFAAGCAVGALGMYYGDPHRGAYRRALVRDKAIHYRRVLRREAYHRSRDLLYRGKGLIARTRAKVLPQRVPDDILIARIESRLGRVIWNPHRFELHADQGKVTINGRVLPQEVELLELTIQETPGVREIDNRMVIVKSARA